MAELFATLTDMVQRSSPLAAFAALAWGVLSVMLSPCHLASIPLVVAFIGAQGAPSGKRAFAISLVFSAGILVTIGAIGAVTAGVGRVVGDVGPMVNYGVAAVFFILGLHFLDVIPLPWSSTGPRSSPRKGLAGAFVLGLVFGIGVGPCTFAFMAPMLGVTFKVAAANWITGVILLLLYGIGHCAVIVIAGTSSQLVQRYLNWTEGSRGAALLRRACGVLVILGGLYLLYTAS